MKYASFGALWASLLWRAMNVSGTGYRVPSLKRNGIGDRRRDKVGLQSQEGRRYADRYPQRFSIARHARKRATRRIVGAG